VAFNPEICFPSHAPSSCHRAKLNALPALKLPGAAPSAGWTSGSLRSNTIVPPPTAFTTHLPDLPPQPLMAMDFAITCLLVRPGRPHIWFLFVRSWLCYTLLSDPASRRRPCVSLVLHHHQVGQGTYTPKLLRMLGTHEKADPCEVGLCRLSGCQFALHALIFSAPNIAPTSSLS
jgi:hypothetical protein